MKGWIEEKLDAHIVQARVFLIFVGWLVSIFNVAALKSRLNAPY